MKVARYIKSSTICAHADVTRPRVCAPAIMGKDRAGAKHARPGRLVDLCCATGVHLIEIADLSEDAIGIDFSAAFIEKAKVKMSTPHVSITSYLFEADVRAIPLDGVAP